MFNPVENFFSDCTMGQFFVILVQYWYSMDCTSPLTGVKTSKIRFWYSIFVILVQCVVTALVQSLQNKRHYLSIVPFAFRMFCFDTFLHIVYHIPVGLCKVYSYPC